MERIQRALDLARLQRIGAAEDDARVAERASLREEFVAPIHPADTVSIDRQTLRDRRILLRDDVGPAANAYRMLRTQVLQRARANGMTTLGVVSAVNGEGKTLTAINLAISIAAEPNQSVALLDLDLRRPAVAQTLGFNANQGLESWLADGGALDRACYSIAGIERLMVMPTLNPVPGSSETLAGSGVRNLIGEIKSREPGRLLILDMPPVLLGDDVLAAAPLLDGVVLVASEARTRREDVARVLELLAGTRVVGTVLNRSSESEQRAY